MDTSGAKHKSPCETALLADGRVAVIGIDDSSSRDAVAQAAARWSSGYPGLRRALERSSRPHLSPKLHRFFRTASDALVFVCHIDADGDAKCHVLRADAANVFDVVGCGANYWVYKSGVVSRERLLDATSGGWLMEELPWTVPDLATGKVSAVSISEGFLLSGKQHQGAAVCPGLWRTYNDSVVAVSRLDAVSWGATVALGGHRHGEMSGVSPGSPYQVTDTGAAIWPESTSAELPRAIRKLAAMSGMALAHQLNIFDVDGSALEIVQAK